MKQESTPRDERRDSTGPSQEQTPEPSNQEVVAEGGQVIEKIDDVASNFRAEEGAESPDLAVEVDKVATNSVEEIKLVLDKKSEGPKIPKTVSAETVIDEPLVFETKHDIRDARIKGNIGRLKALLDEINIAIQKSDRALKQRSLEQAAVLLNDPRFADQSTELSSTLEQAQLSAENKIRDLEIEIKTAQMERLLAPLKDLIIEINTAKTREAKLSVLQKAAQLLNKPDLATAILQKSKEEQDLLVPDALEQAVLLAEARIRKIEDEINKLKNGVGEEPIVNPEPETINSAPTGPETSPEVVPESVETPVETPVIPEKIEKDLGYLDIDPKAIWEKLSAKDIVDLQVLMKAGDMAKINEFYQSKIKEVLVDQKKDQAEDEVLLKQMAESINAIIQQKVELEAERELLKTGLKGKSAMLGKIALNVGIMGGTSLLVGSLGVATGGVGALIGAAGVTGVRLLMRKIEENRQKTTPDSVKERSKKEEAENLAKEKAKIIDTIFSPDNLEKLRKQLSGHIANTLREQTSGHALKALKEYKQVDGAEGSEVSATKLREVEKQLYLNALTMVRAEHPEATPEQQKNMALTWALTLGQHERGENLAKKRLEEIKKSKPALYKIIEKYNLLSAGSPDKKPSGLSKEEESIWQKSKYDLMSMGIGTAVGTAVRTSGVARVAMGSVAGAGLGYRAGEWMEKRDEKKALAEIVKMIDESEQVIQDIEFPTDQIEKLKKDSIFVKSKLDLGLLDSDPLLKSRAENFIHQVQKIELKNQESLEKLLASVSERTDLRVKQVEDDLDRIGSKIKNRRLWATIGGAVVGGAAAWYIGELTKKDEATPASKPPAGSGNTWQNIQNLYDHDEQATAEHDPLRDIATAQHEAPELRFEDTIDSSKVNGSDSIWRSTHQIFEDHAKELGYKGDLNDHEVLSKWAETQTANTVQHLNQEQGGNLADLVHDGDKVRVEILDGKPHLSFEASSGIEASHLSDTNVGHLADQQNFNANIDHHLAIDPKTGDQYLEIKSGDGAYKVYDWDRDGRPNVFFPDGHSQEMSQQELSKFLADKNIINVPVENVQIDVEAAKAAAETAAKQQVETFLAQGGEYNHGLYEAANNSGHLDELVAKIVASGNQEQLSGLVHDYVREHGWSEEKTNLFISALKRGDKIDLSSGHFDLNNPQVIAENMHGFESSALDSFDKVKSIPSGHWVPVRMGDEYALVQKYHTGVWPLRSDHYLIDTDGDHKVDALKLDDNAMRQAFLKKGAESIKSTVKGVINKFPPGSHPSPM